MNQIPNIEEEFENYIYQLYQQYFSLEEKGLIPHSTYYVTDSVNFEEIVVKHKEILHHQLQKARQDIHTSLVAEVEGKKLDDTCGDCDGTAVNTYLRNGEDCTSCRGTGIDSSCHNYNQALDDSLTIINSIFKE